MNSIIILMSLLTMCVIFCALKSINQQNQLEHFFLSNYKKTYEPQRELINKYIENMTTPVMPYVKPHKNSDESIPRNVYMTWHSSELPPMMKKHIDIEIANNPEFNFFIYDLEKCRNFIKNHFHISVLNAFDTLQPIAYKADLWRCCVLYIKGGIYLDIKLVPVNGFKFIDIIDKERFTLERDGTFWENKTFGISNALIIAKAGNEILYDCIKNIVDNVNNKFYGFNNLYPTGPGLMGQIYFEHKKRYDDMDLFFVGFPDGRYTMQLGKYVILQSYPEYNIERHNGGQSSYAKFYNERNIYGEKI